MPVFGPCLRLAATCARARGLRVRPPTRPATSRRVPAFAGALALILAPLAACDREPAGPAVVACGRIGSVRVVAPERVRQGDAVQVEAQACAADGELVPLASNVDWRLVEADAGWIGADGTFVPYRSQGSVRVVAEAGGADTATIAVEPRGIGGAFEVLGQGSNQDRHTSDLWVHGAYAYLGTWGCRGGGSCGDRLYAWNVADPAKPVLTDSVLVDALTVNDVKVSADGSLAVITHEGSQDGLNGITLLDLADPAHPAAITRYTDGLEGGVHNVWIEGDHVYAVSHGAAGMHVIDVSDPANPTRVARFHAGTSFIHDVYVRDGLAFVSHWDAGLYILDVGNGVRGGSPAAPAVVSFVPTDGGNVHNAWYWPEAGYVFVGEEDFSRPGMMHVVDLRDPAHPMEVARFALPGEPPHNFWLDERRGILFAAWYGQGLRAIDVTGTLAGDLTRQGREYASVRPAGQGGAARVWAPQLVDDVVFISDMDNGLWSLGFVAHAVP